MILSLFVILLSFLLIFAFSSYETAFLIVQRKSFTGLAPLEKKFLNRVDSVLATILVGLNFFSATASIVTFSLLKNLNVATGEAIGLAGAMVSLFIMLLEFSGKNIARKSSDTVIQILTPLVKVFSYFAVPINKIILSLIFPLRTLKKETRKDRIELLKLMVTESLMNSEISPQIAETILTFTKLPDMKVESFAEPLENYFCKSFENIVNLNLKKKPILVRNPDGSIKKFDPKRYLITMSIEDSFKEVPELKGGDSVELALKTLYDEDENIALVITREGVKVFYLKSFLENLLGVRS